MCDQTEVSYLEDDVVWVKIGPIWWPGVVKDLEKDDTGKEILAGLKKKPIAVVKFFQENNYEFVKNLDGIYHYNCSRKDEFIKKGLDKFRAGAPHMKKFPADVTTAESLTNGDVNITNDPKFLPEKKESYSEIFGSGKKKTKKEGDATLRSRNAKASAGVTPYRPITHQRFINKVLRGESDHKVKTLIQTSPSSEDGASKNPYICHICKFETSRVNVIVAHHRLSHSTKNSINWTGSDDKMRRKKTVYKARKSRTKKLFDTLSEFSDVEIEDKTKSVKRKSLKDKKKMTEKKDNNSLSPSKRKIKDQSEEIMAYSKKPRFTDVLLADWNEEFEEDKKEIEEKSLKAVESLESKSDAPLEGGENKSENALSLPDSAENLTSIASNKNGTGKMSCFDFEEEEEGFIGMNNANTYGRKIPRVIPLKDKSELGVEMDLEMDDFIQKKNDTDLEISKEDVEKNGNDKQDEKEMIVSINEERFENVDEVDKEVKQTVSLAKRRRSKASKEEEQKVNAQNSLALRRTRRPGAKKSYLNEVIEQIADEKAKNKPETNEATHKEKESLETSLDNSKKETVKVEVGSSSRRKQDFKNQTFDEDREETVYSDIVKNEQKLKSAEGFEKKKGKHQNSRKESKDDIVVQIDSLLEETKPNQLPGMLEPAGSEKNEVVEEKFNASNFSFDYLPSEQISGNKNLKSKTEIKSISKMFGDSIPATDIALEGDSQVSESEISEAMTATDLGQNKTFRVGNIKFSQGNNLAQKKGSIILSTSKNNESPLKVIPVAKQSNASKECIVLPGKKKIDETGDDEESSEAEKSEQLKNIKTIRVKSDTIPSSLLTAGKLKGQTIIHQKSGKYVIVTQPHQTGRQRITPGKVQTGSKVVILTSQHGEQKIITTSGLQQNKFKMEGSKVMTASNSAGDKETLLSAPTSQPQNSQPVIKMVPDGKGGIMKQLTVSPKKVLFGGTKVLVSGSGSTFSSGNSVQKIALSETGGSAKSGDFRLIENYKGSGKTVLIQGNSNTGGGVVLKPSSVIPRTVTKVVQNPQSIPALKKKPKILMRTSSGQGEYVVQSASGAIESPTYVVKQKGIGGKFSAQKLVRTEIINQAKVSPSSVGTKRFFVSGQGSAKKGESYLITTNEALPSKVIRMRQKIKEVDTSIAPKTPQKMVSKNPELYAVAQNSLILPSQGTAETETAQIVQIEGQPQQPVLQTQVIAMPGPIGVDGNQTYVLVSVDENGVVQGVDNSVVAYDASSHQDQIFLNSTSTNNVMILNSQTTEEAAPVFSTSSQDILAEALANTNVLEGNMNNEMDAVVPSILLPPSIPSSVVQETSITLQKPIMTPLEMPSSVAPDTSSLEPPPLPPTPTDEDVLMEESEMPIGGGLVQTPLNVQNEGETNIDESVKEQPQAFEGVTDQADNSLKEVQSVKEYEKENSHRSNDDEDFKHLQKEDIALENPSDEPVAASYQSMPLLNDEPDTSDDTHGAEPGNDQHLDFTKSRMDGSQMSRFVKEQEPPSSTINESTGNRDTFAECEKFEKNSDDKIYENDGHESLRTNIKELKEIQEKEIAENEEQQHKDVPSAKETQSMPIITDDGPPNVFDLDPLHHGVVTQKRFQEETEVSSTTDEYTNKSVPR